MDSIPETISRFRFSLVNILLVMTVVGMALVIFLQQQDLQGLHQVLGDSGYLTVQDETKFQSVFVPTFDELTWRWRLWLPRGKQYQVAAVCNQVPSSGYPEHPELEVMRWGKGFALGPRIGISPGEHLLTVALRRDTLDGREKIHFDIIADDGTSHFTGSQTLERNIGQWPFSGDHSVSMGSPDLLSKQSIKGEARFLLMRFRTATGRITSGIDEPPSDGLMLWIEPL